MRWPGRRTADREGTGGAHDWLRRSIVFFGGKGGVGKTTCAAAFALLNANLGRRTLLVSTDPAHSTADLLDQPLGPQERRIAEALWAIEIDPEVEARAYIERVRQNMLAVVKPQMRDEIERQIEIARVSPGAEEAALFDKIAALLEEKEQEQFDLLVFDTAPTGHTLRLLSLPELMGAWVEGLLARRRQVNHLAGLWRNLTLGSEPEPSNDPVERVLERRRRTFLRARRLLLDAERTAFIFVLNAERLPILETRKSAEILRQHGIPVGGLIVNRVLPADVADHPFLGARKQQEQVYLDEIERLFADLPRLRLPLLDHDIAGHKSLEQITAHLRAAIGR